MRSIIPSKRSVSRPLRSARKRIGLADDGGVDVLALGVIGPSDEPEPITTSSQARAASTAYPLSGSGT